MEELAAMQRELRQRMSLAYLADMRQAAAEALIADIERGAAECVDGTILPKTSPADLIREAVGSEGSGAGGAPGTPAGSGPVLRAAPPQPEPAKRLKLIRN
jgi:hypothetical protein